MSRSVRSLLVHALFLSSSISAGAWAGLVDCSYIGLSGGSFGTAANWDCGNVPNSTNNAIIDGKGPLLVSMNVSPIVGAVTIGADDELSCNNNTTLDVTAATNDGLISLNSAGNQTNFRIRANPTNLDGGGTLLMGPNFQNRIDGAFFDINLVNGADHTIRGSGQIGVDVIELVNHGVVRADQSAAVLQLDLRNGADQNINTGTLLAASGGTLVLINSAIDNSTGQIRANNSSFVNLNGSTILGGDYTTTGTGVIQLTGSSTLVDPSNTGQMNILNNVTGTFSGTVDNESQITVNSFGNQTNFRIGSNPTTLTGSGELLMGPHFQNRIDGTAFGIDLVNAADHTIRGSGQIGVDVIDVVNQGLIRADNPVEVLQFDLRNGTDQNINDGVIEAVNGATVHFLNSAINNTNGLMRADADSFFDINGSTIVGGELTTLGSGQVRITGSSTLVDPSNTGQMNILNNVTGTFSGTVDNESQITVNSVGNQTNFRIGSNPTTLTGSGELVMGPHIQNRIDGTAFDIDLVNAADHTIRGSGQFGVDVIELENHGVVRADQSAAVLQFDLRNGTDQNINDGVIEAVNGATVHFLNSAINNTNGLMRADADSFFDINGSTIVGGELTTLGSGQVRITGSSTLSALTNTGDLSILNNVTGTFSGTITNQNQITVNSVGNQTNFRIGSNPTTLTGSGELLMGPHIQNRIDGTAFDIDLVNAAGHTIRGSGQFGVDVIDIANQGSIIADNAVGMSIDQRNSFVNEGVIHVTDDGALSIQSGPFTTSGFVTIDSTRTLTRVGNFDQTGGVTLVNGILSLTSGGVTNLGGGILAGDGQVNGHVNNTGGAVAPGNSAGSLNLSNSYTQGPGGSFLTEIGGEDQGTQYDHLIVAGTATLAGEIVITRINAFQPTPGVEFTVLSAANRVGEFDTVSACDPVEIIYTATEVKVVFGKDTGIVGDLNGDDEVDGVDLGQLLLVWGPCGLGCCFADFNEDSEVDGADLGTLLLNWTG